MLKRYLPLGYGGTLYQLVDKSMPYPVSSNKNIVDSERARGHRGVWRAHLSLRIGLFYKLFPP